MKGFISFLCSAATARLLCLPAATAVPQVIAQDSPPAWAYPVNPPGFKAPPDDGTARHVPDSALTHTLSQVRDRFFAPDWHPGDHASMPEVVARGRKPDISAWGFCHRTNGAGGPENANIAGLPADYIIQQLADFRSGARKSAVQKRAPTELKARLAQHATDAEIAAAAAYFATIPTQSFVEIVETDMVPKTFVTGWHLAAVTNGEKEPIGLRIIEVPKDLELFISRDSRAQFVAYVPVGSIQKGQQLATTGGDGKTVQCSLCHGPDLKGVGPIPSIAGRSPTYIVRQLYDFKRGARAGPASQLMKQSVENLSIDDMIILAAYTASLKP
jgi:cytochrome c553